MTDPIPFVSNGTRKTKNQTRIAHISDLHFTSTTDVEKEDVWTALSEDLETSDADLLVVTGDIIDSSVRDNFRKEGVAKALVRKAVARYANDLMAAVDLAAISI